MLIRNYGLFWHEQRVNWGKPKVSGTLEGYCRGAKTWGAIDFREQRGVYVLYDTTFKPVYVGQAGRGNQCLFARLKQHRRDHLAERWSRFSWFGTRSVDGYGSLKDDEEFAPKLPNVLDHIEAILLAVSEPPLNLQRGRFGSKVEQYLQMTTRAEAATDATTQPSNAAPSPHNVRLRRGAPPSQRR